MSHVFEWSTQTYSVRDVIYRLTCQLPLIVRVNEGYCSNDFFHDFGAEQMLRIYDIKHQERVVAQESGGRYLSIPVSYPQHVRITYSDGRVVKYATISTVADIIRKQPSKNFSMTFENDNTLRTGSQTGVDNVTADSGASDFGVLQPINVYQEPFLLAHTIIDGELHDANTFVPAYVRITMSVAIGIWNGIRDEFLKVLADFKTAAASCRNDCVAGKQEIIIFPQSPCENDYEYIVPVMHIKVAEADNWRTNYDSYANLCNPGKLSSDLYFGSNNCTSLSQPSAAEQSSATCHPRPSAPTIPVRAPIRKVTSVKKTPSSTASNVTLPMAVNVAKSQRCAAAKPRIATISPQPILHHASPSDVNNMSTSPRTAYLRLRSLAKNSGRPLPSPPPLRLGVESKVALPLSSVACSAAVGDKDDDVMNKDVSTLSTNEVSAILMQLKMPEYIKVFLEKDVDGDMLSCLEEIILVDDFNFTKFNAKKLMKYVKEGYIPRIGMQHSSHISNV